MLIRAPLKLGMHPEFLYREVGVWTGSEERYMFIELAADTVNNCYDTTALH